MKFHGHQLNVLYVSSDQHNTGKVRKAAQNQRIVLNKHPINNAAALSIGYTTKLTQTMPEKRDAILEIQTIYQVRSTKRVILYLYNNIRL